MDSKQQFDFWYAVNNTELIVAPSNQLETFGDTVINYYLVCELMDSVDQVRVREGHLKALKPTIITPQALGQVDLEDFGDDAQHYAEWLAKHGGDLKLIQYGFRIQKKEVKEYIVTDRLEAVLDRVKTEVADQADPLSAVLVGVDSPWQVCLLKLMVELVQNSARGNMHDFQRQVLSQQESLDEQMDRAFLTASRDASKIQDLAATLKQNGLWGKYEDRFFALVKASENQG